MFENSWFYRREKTRKIKHDQYILETPGGSGEIAEDIVNLMREKI